TLRGALSGTRTMIRAHCPVGSFDTTYSPSDVLGSALPHRARDCRPGPGPVKATLRTSRHTESEIGLKKPSFEGDLATFHTSVWHAATSSYAGNGICKRHESGCRRRGGRGSGGMP